MNTKRRFPRIRISLPPEGFIFIVILGFVTVCSILRNVNLLVVVSGMMIVSLLFCWRFSRNAVRNVIVNRVTPNRIHVGQPTNIQWHATNAGQHSVFALKIVDSFQQECSRLGQVQPPRKRNDTKANGQVVFDRIDPKETAYSSFHVLFNERGVYKTGPAYVESNFPLALVKSWFRTEQTNQFHVAPRIGQLANYWDQIIAANSNGNSSRSFVEGSQEEEFFAIREFRSGDNTRKIHWRSTAKYGKPMVKQFDRTTKQNLAFVLDLAVNESNANSVEQYNNRINSCETILSFATTVLSNWIETAFGNLDFGIAGEKSEFFASSRHANFIRSTMRSFANAQSGPGVCLNPTLQAVCNSISSEVPCYVISSRPFEEAASQIEPELKSRINWIEIDGDMFNRIFSQSESTESRFSIRSLSESMAKR